VIREVEKNDRVYLIDNGSTDGSIEYVAKHFPGVKIIKFETNLGFALAYNLAVAQVSEEILVFLNNDVEVDEGWLAQLKVSRLKSAGRTIILGSKILLYDNRNVINHGGGSLTPIGAGIDNEYMRKDTRRAEKPRFVGCVSGASMMISRQAFQDLGGFDPSFFAYFEDVDLCWRAWLEGYGVLYQPSSRVYHKLGSTLGPRLTAGRVFLGERNQLQALLTNLELLNVLTGLLASFLYNVIRITRLLRASKPRTALAILRGDWWVLKNLSGVTSKRMHVQQRRKVSDRFLLRYGLMIGLADGIREFIRISDFL